MAARANNLNGRDWLLNSFSVWRDLPRDGERKSHPAAFPVALAGKILDCYAQGPDDVVLDPFAGSGSTLLAAARAGMRSLGLDINEQYREFFLDRVDLVDLAHCGGADMWRYEVCDSRDRRAFLKAVAKQSVGICITSPPYWDILRRRRSSDGKKAIAYSDSVTDIGNIADYGEFLQALGDVAENIGIALKDRGYLILNVMDLRKGGRFYPLHQDAAEVVTQRGGLHLEDIIIWDRQKDYNQMRPLGYPHKFIINKVHEYLLVFRKTGE